MHVVAIGGWQGQDREVAQVIAEALGILVFEARQRTAGGGPSVLASYADPQQAEALAARLLRDGVPALVIDAAAVRGGGMRFEARRFVLGAEKIRIELSDGRAGEIAYREMALLLAGTTISGQMQTTTTITERKFSLGKTLLAGGVPMTKKVKHTETVTTEERDEILCLYAGRRPPVVFRREAMNYDGLGAAMQLSRDLNFSHLKTALRRLAPAVVYDDRLLRRAGQIRLLGSLDPENNLALAFEILARSLSPGLR